MRALRRWLQVGLSGTVAVNPSATVDVPLSLAPALAACAKVIEDALGGNVARRDDAAGSIEATFGLIHSERIACECVALDDRNTRVRIVSRTLLGSAPRTHSDYVARLAAHLQNAS